MQLAMVARKVRLPPAIPSRRELLDSATREVTRGRVKAAIRHYASALEHHGPDPAIEAKLAALHARRKQLAQAHHHFRSAAAQFLAAGFEEKALAVFRTAVVYFPRDIDLWEGIVRLQCARRCPADAVKTLLEGRRRFSKRSLRSQAIRLLRQALALDPSHQAATFDLAVLLAKVGEREQAAGLLTGLASRSHGGRLRRVRGALFRLEPSFPTAWRWLRAAVLGR